MSTNTIRLHRVFRATPERICRAFLDADALIKWLPPNGFSGKIHHLERILMEHRGVSQFKGPDDFVFCRADGTPLDPDSLRRCGIYPALKAAGVPFVKRASGCHAFRHLVGSVIHKETGSLKDAGEQLGHADVSTTGNIYVHVDDEQIDRNAEILGRVLGICGKSVVNPVLESERVQ